MLDVPSARPRYPLEFTITLRRHGPRVFESLARQYGDVVRLSVAGNPLMLVSHPDDIHEILTLPYSDVAKGRALERGKRLLGEGLLNSHGEFHLSQRRLIQPAFHRQRLSTYAVAMIDESIQVSSRWKAGGWLDIHRAMMDLTLAIVCRTLLGTSVGRDVARIRAAIDTALDIFKIVQLPGQAFLERLPIGPGARFKAAKAVLDEVIYRILAEHRQAGGDSGDLLSMLLIAQDQGRSMTDRQIRDEVLTIFLAGHETTANALTWTWYLLSQHPLVEKVLHAELDAVLGDRPPTPEDMPRLPYTRQVLSESLRLYPPAWAIGRRAIHDLDLRRFHVSAETVMITSPWVVQHDARWYPDPYRFDPSRWTPEAEAARPRMAYFPFGAGSRICIGEHFAWLEGVLLLASIAQRWRMTRIGTAPFGLQAGITLRPSRPVLMRLHARAPRSRRVSERMSLSG